MLFSFLIFMISYIIYREGISGLPCSTLKKCLCSVLQHYHSTFSVSLVLTETKILNKRMELLSLPWCFCLMYYYIQPLMLTVLGTVYDLDKLESKSSSVSSNQRVHLQQSVRQSWAYLISMSTVVRSWDTGTLDKTNFLSNLKDCPSWHKDLYKLFRCFVSVF